MIVKALMGFCLLFVFSLSTVSCTKKEEVERNRLKVVTSLFPFYDFAKNIGRENVELSLLLPPGVEPHSFEPTPEDIKKIAEGDIFIYTNKAMEPWIDDVLKGIENKDLAVIDSSSGITFMDADPHIWLDFLNAQKAVDNILDGFLRKDPKNKDFYTKNAEDYKARLDELDRDFKIGLSDCRKDTFIHAGHFAFNYLTKRYNIEYLSAYGTAPDSEPTPKRLMLLLKKTKELGIKHICYEELIKPEIANVLSKETGAELVMLHAGHNITREEMDNGITFITLMRENLKNLRIALQCR
ncbi:MAG: zinc ABC transporter substrate-binding protein [Nitrospirae bacterium]|nr:zinc ABC transporter substrate-binding protein [Nitrospirota bacterium]